MADRPPVPRPEGLLLTACLPPDATELDLLAIAKAERGKPAGRDAASRVLGLHHGLIVKLVEYMLLPGFEFDDMLQEANMAGLEAIRYFNPERGFKFPTYLADCVRRRVFKWRNTRRNLPLPQESAGEDARLFGAVSPDNDEGQEAASDESTDLLEVLTDRQASVVRLWHGIGQDRALGTSHIANRLGMKVVEVKREYERAIARLRQEGVETGRLAA